MVEGKLQTSLSNHTALVQQLWNCGTILRDEGLSHGDHGEQLTFLPFLKMAEGQSRPPFKQPSTVPKEFAYLSLLARDGDWGAGLEQVG